jgi:hypothetical protein
MKATSSFVVLAIGCFSLAFTQRDGEERAKAIKAIEKKDGIISYDEKAPAKPVIEVLFHFTPGLKDEDLVHLKPLRSLWNLFLEGTPITSKGLLQLDAFDHLERLNLIKTKIDDDALKWVAKNKGLRVLGLNDTNITDKGLSHISGLKELEGLLLSGTKVTDAGLTHLKGMTTLQRLYLEKTAVTDEGVASLQKALPNLWIIR